MKITKAVVLFLLILNNFEAKSQFELSTGLGLNSSIPLNKRDTFDGSQTITFSVMPKFSVNKNLVIISAAKHLQLKTSNNNDASEILYQSVLFGMGGEYRINENKKSSFFLMFNSGFLYKYGKNVLSQSSSTGYSFVEMSPKNKFIQNTEFGFFYYPRDYFMVKGSISQPLFYKKEKYQHPAFIELSAYYRLDFSKKSKLDENLKNPEKDFCKNLQKGKLYILENRKDTIYHSIRRAFAEKYKFSRVCFIDNEELKTKLDSFANSPDFKNIFIAKTGTIVYDIGRAATNGIIIYDYRMQNPIEDKPVFVRNRSSDVDFENIETANRIVSKLNSMLFNQCNIYKF